MICYECGKPIDTTFGYWKKYYKVDVTAEGLPVYEERPVCDRCAEAMVDEHTGNGLRLGVKEQEK